MRPITQDIILHRTQNTVKRILEYENGATLIDRTLKPNKLLHKLNGNDMCVIANKVYGQTDENTNTQKLDKLITEAAFEVADAKPLPYCRKAESIPMTEERKMT